MDRAIEALDAGDAARARQLCEETKHEWRYLHDLMASGVLSLISFVQGGRLAAGSEDEWSITQDSAAAVVDAPWALM